MAFRQNHIASIPQRPSILFFDIEMTGGNCLSDEILQFTLVDLYKGIVFNKYIKPEKCTAWKETEKVHHITPAMVQDCSPLSSYRRSIKRYLTNADMIVGYGIENDLRFMKKNKLFVGRRTIIYDLQKSFSRISSSNSEMPSLRSCAGYCACPSFGRLHNSLTDTCMTIYCFIALYGLEMPAWLDHISKDIEDGSGPVN